MKTYFKKNLIFFTFICLSPLSYAEYILKYPLEQKTGGNLPDGTISINPKPILENWVTILPDYSVWVNNGNLTGCSNWSPSESTVLYNQNFTQTATDCSINQVRNKQEREQDTYSSVIRNVGDSVVEYQTLSNQTSTRSAVGSYHNTWIALAPTYTTWTNTGEPTNCTWTPAASTINKDVTFTQNGTNCNQLQTRSKQNSEQEEYTKEIRNVGSATVESQTLVNQAASRQALGTKIVPVCSYTEGSNFFHGNSSGYNLYLGGDVKGSTTGSPIIFNGISYTVGSYVRLNSSDGRYAYYQICSASAQ